MHVLGMITLALTLAFGATAPRSAAPDNLPTKTRQPDRKVKKFTLVALDSAAKFTAQYNPKEISIDKAVPWTEAKSSISDQPHLEFKGADGRTMSFELMFDTMEAGTDVHEVYVAKLMAFAMVIDSSASAPEDKKRPPRVKVLGLGSIKFEGVVESIDVKYTMFNPNGIPVRATCAVKLREASRASFKR